MLGWEAFSTAGDISVCTGCIRGIDPGWSPDCGIDVPNECISRMVSRSTVVNFSVIDFLWGTSIACDGCKKFGVGGVNAVAPVVDFSS